MRLSNVWFNALSEGEDGNLVTILGRAELQEFIDCGKLKERIEITWKYEPESKGMPPAELALQMEVVQEAIRKAVEKDKLAILTAVYTGSGEKIWNFYTRTTRVFCERLNEALASFDLLPITLYSEIDADWDEYLDMCDIPHTD